MILKPVFLKLLTREVEKLTHAPMYVHICTQEHSDLTKSQRMEGPKSTVYIPVSILRPADFIALRTVKNCGEQGSRVWLVIIALA